ncbi:MAG: hypothetical protein EG825_05530 [Rhodocyclaceae bacterium]|nr:hypothetical protein [Rhodocyclaceae bacterium]
MTAYSGYSSATTSSIIRCLMLKWLLLFLVVFVIYKSLSARARPSQVASKSRPENVVACAHCGIFIPQSEALTDDSGQQFCSEDHRLNGAKD